MADWSLLPSDLLGSIAGLVGVADRARMTAVCKQWWLAMADGFCRGRAVPDIWLLLPRGSDDGRHDDSCEFPSFSEGMMRSYFFSLPGGGEPLDKVEVIGSSKGWIFLEDERTRLQAFNPITKTRLLFPNSGGRLHPNVNVYRKAVFVPKEAGRRSDKPVMVAVLRWGGKSGEDIWELAFAIAGDDVWTDLPAPLESTFQDIAAHDGKLYALSETNNVLVFDLGDERASSSPAPVTTIDVEPNLNPYFMKHLGVIAGDLVLLQWWICTACPSLQERCLPTFEVLQLQTNKHNQKEWVEVSNLGGHAILLGFDGFVALPIDEFRELAPNYIYSVDDSHDSENVGLVSINMVNGATIFDALPFPSCTPFWFLPNADI